MRKLLLVIFGCFGALLANAGALDRDWKACASALDKRQIRSATNVLSRIESAARARKSWPDFAAAILCRMRCEGAIAEENALDAERPGGRVARYAAQVEAAPAEVRPMLRLALANEYFALNGDLGMWRGDRTRVADAEELPPWSDERLVSTLTNLLAKIAADKAMLQKEKLSGWRALISPGDAFAQKCLPTLWDFVVNDAVSFAGLLCDDKGEVKKKVLGGLDECAALHPLETEGDAHVHALYRKLQLEEGDKENFAEKWFDVSAVSAEAAYAAAQALSESEKGEDRVRAHRLAARFGARWPTSTGGLNCLALVRNLERPAFSVKTETQLLARGERLEVESRNLTNLCFRLVPMTFEESRDKVLLAALSGGGKPAQKRMEKLFSRKPAAEWSVAVEDPRDYVERKRSYPVPEGLALGSYMLFAAPNGRFGADGLPCECAAMNLTDLHLVSRLGKEGADGYVSDALTGFPIPDAAVELWKYDGKKRDYVIVSATKTKSDGSWNLAVPEAAFDGFVRTHKADKGDSRIVVPGWRTRETTPKTDSLYLVTDRAIYRPGQTVKFKGYAYHAEAKKRDFHVIAHRRVFVQFLDTNGKRITELALVSNDFGTFSGEFTAPRDRLTGEFMLQAQLRAESGADEIAKTRRSVRVEEYKRPKFTVAFEKAEGQQLGVETKLIGVAKTYTGLPVAAAKVKWTLTRMIDHPYWWRWLHDWDGASEEVASGEGVTDEKGAFVCTFVPTAPEKNENEIETKYYFTCEADVTDAAGEMHAAETGFTVGLAPWKVDLMASADVRWTKRDTGIKWRVDILTNADEPIVGGEAEIKVYALSGPARPVRRSLDYHREECPEIERWENGACVQSFKATTDRKGKAEGRLAVPAGAYRVEATVTTADGKTIRDKRVLRVFDPTAKTYAVMEPWYCEVEKAKVSVGGTARLFFGTGYASGYCRIRVWQGEKMLLETTREGTNGVFEFPVKEEHRGTLAFSIVFVRENRLYQDVQSIAVPWDNLELKVTREHMTSKLLPGAKETWRFRISGTDTNDVRRGVEALAFMYDKSLDELRRHYVRLPFAYNFSQPLGRIGRWKEANRRDRLSRWRGQWPECSDEACVSWPAWKPWTLKDDGVFMECLRTRATGGFRCCEVPKCLAAEDASNFFECIDPVSCCMKTDEENEETLSEGDDKAEKPPRVVPRKNLQETAFFLPTLVSDEKGNVEFSFTVPEALTGWKFQMLAHDRNLANGYFANDGITTVKPLMVEPNGPRFAREGDVFKFPVKVTNTDDKMQSGEVTLAFADAESGKAESRLCRAAKGFAFALKPGETKTFEFPLVLPEGCGSLTYVAKAAGREFADGEEGFLPVLSRRVLVQESLPMQIRTAGEKKFTFRRFKEGEKSDTLKNLGLVAQVVSDPAWYAFLALPYLMEYPHECNEQVFSRYYANALAAKIAKADPAYKAMFLAWEQAGANAVKSPLELNAEMKSLLLEATPWVRAAEDETKAKRHLGELFGSARLEAEQQRALKHLRENATEAGLWPWFPGGPGSAEVTMEILTGFARLEALGVPIAGGGRFVVRARAALDERLENDIARRLEKRNAPFRLGGFDLRWLYLQSFDKSWNKKYAKLLFEHLEKEWTDFNLAGESLAAMALWRYGKKDLAKEIVTSLKERAVRSEEKGLYWKRAPFFDGSLFGSPVSDQTLAMEAFLLVDPEDAGAYEDARRWLLEEKRTQNWSSTVSTCDAVYAILLGRGKAAPAKVGPVTMTLGGEKVPQEKAEAGTGFYEWRYAADRVKPAMGDIVLSREEDAPGWASLTWTYLEDATKVTDYEEKDLRLTKTYYKKVSVKGKAQLVALGGGEKLEPGDELVSRITIDSNRVYAYVHLKDERPASAEPVDVLSRYRFQDGLGYYQSTRDTATHYYFDRLPRGNFVLETSFRVRQRGTFSSGLATLECMYAPEFGAHSSATVLRVGE